MEKTLILFKPDTFERGLFLTLSAEMRKFCNLRRLRIIDEKQVYYTPFLAKMHYLVHKDKPFYGELTEFISKQAIIGMVIEGNGAIRLMRNFIKHIRKTKNTTIMNNLMHGSDSNNSFDWEYRVYDLAENSIHVNKEKADNLVEQLNKEIVGIVNSIRAIP